jgi:hypothetical protein
MRLPLAVAATAALVLQVADAGTDDHKYKKDEHVELWVNKVCCVTTTAQNDPFGSGHCALRLSYGGLVANRTALTFLHDFFRLLLLFRLDPMLTLKKLMNIICFLIAHPTQNITQRLRVERAVGMNGKPIRWGNTWGDMHSVIPVMTLPF